MGPMQRTGEQTYRRAMRLSNPLLYACTLALIAVVPVGASARSTEKPAHCTVTATGWKGHVTGKKLKPTHPAVERRVILLVNRFRHRHGLRPLKLDPGLRYAARARGAAGTPPTARLALYSPSRCVAERVVREDGRVRAAAIVRTWRSERKSRQALLLPWARRIGVGVHVGRFKGERATTATVVFSAARPKPTKPRAVRVKPKPAPRPAAPPPAAVPAQPPAPPSGPVVGVPYTCNGPVHGLRVVGTGSDPRALIHLEAGCTGSLSFDIHVTSGGGDGVKVHAGAHDLTIGPSRIVCDRLIDTSFHQDGVQVQGGTNVTFNGLSIVCPYVTGQGAAGFYIDGKDFGGISNVVCDGCNLEHLHYGAMFTGPAPGSGVRNSVIHQGALTHGYFAILGDPTGALDSNNTPAPHCDGTGVPC
jgi:Cysteine-rich secretory protein family